VHQIKQFIEDLEGVENLCANCTKTCTLAKLRYFIKKYNKQLDAFEKESANEDKSV